MKLTAERVSVIRGKKRIVDEVSFSLTDGQWLMLVGPNGAGKSTLIAAVSGAVPFEGLVALDGEQVRGMKPAHLARRVGVMSQRTSMTYAFTVEEVVAMGRYAHRRGVLGGGDSGGQARIDEAIEAVGLGERRRQSMLTLSGGERQRAFLAQVLCQEPDLLILDEPGNHLDLQYQQQLFDLADQWRRQHGRAVISVVHDLSIARLYGTHALLMDGGKGIFGSRDEVLTPERLSRVWGMDVQAWMRRLYSQWEN